MQKKIFSIITFFMVSILIIGCSPQKTPAPDEKKTEQVKLYYGDAGNEKFVTEEREITLTDGEDKYVVVLEELIKGPENPDYKANISQDTKVYGTIKQDNDLIVDLSSEFNRFEGSVAEIIGVGSVVNSLAQFSEIKRVKILVDGNELIGPSGQARGFMEPITSETSAKETEEETQNVVLYFGNKNATAVVGETRTIRVPQDAGREGLIKAVLEELIKGPEREDLYKTIPKEVKVRTVRLTDQTAEVDFSQEMISEHWGGAAGESMTINSIVNTLTEFEFIKKVKMTVDGQPMNIEHSVLDEPVERNESMIER